MFIRYGMIYTAWLRKNAAIKNDKVCIHCSAAQVEKRFHLGFGHARKASPASSPKMLLHR